MEKITPREVSLLSLYQQRLRNAGPEDIMEVVNSLCRLRNENQERQEIIDMIQAMVDKERERRGV
ncbi:hypothetical protein KJ885_05035 [Patescibacteria group bacterium]|nr:hypothetical protein [Patescibacteria group bacterium]